jgi:hypothetical protein
MLGGKPSLDLCPYFHKSKKIYISEQVIIKDAKKYAKSITNDARDKLSKH